MPVVEVNAPSAESVTQRPKKEAEAMGIAPKKEDAAEPATAPQAATDAAEQKPQRELPPDGFGESQLLAHWAVGAPYASMVETCDIYHQLRVRTVGQEGPDGSPVASHCKLGDALQVSGAAPSDVNAVHWGEVAIGGHDDLGYGRVGRFLVVEAKLGWFPASVFIDPDPGGYDTRASVLYVNHILASHWENDTLFIELLARKAISGGYPPEGPLDLAAHYLMRCRRDEGKVVCQEHLTAYRDSLPVPELFFQDSGIDPFKPPQTWDWQRTWRVEGDVTLLGECQTAGGARVNGKSDCLAPRAAELREPTNEPEHLPCRWNRDGTSISDGKVTKEFLRFDESTVSGEAPIVIVGFAECGGWGECVSMVLESCGDDQYRNLWGPDYAQGVKLARRPGGLRPDLIIGGRTARAGCDVPLSTRYHWDRGAWVQARSCASGPGTWQPSCGQRPTMCK